MKLVALPEGDPKDVDKKLIPVPLPESKVWISPDFDEPDQDIIDAFEGKYANDEVVFDGFICK